MKEMSKIDWIAFILVIIGALNWGLIAISADWNLVAILASLTNNLVGTIIYALVGLSGLWVLWSAFK
jgi:uncharacterized protein